MDKKQVIVSFSPALFEHYYQADSIIVIIDAIRMSATITTAIANGATEILPLASVDETLSYKGKGYLIAAERDTNKVEGFDFGNSPLDFVPEKVNGKRIAISTTNGTQVISLIQQKSNGEAEMLIGTFLNVSFLAEYLSKQNKNVLIQCSGWKNTVATEDILFAGMLSGKLLEREQFYFWRDGVYLAHQLYLQAKTDLRQFIYSASPRLNAKKEQLDRDIRYCLELDKFEVIPEWQENKIVRQLEL
jgi:2-phosphosulfolactate phosphatase